MAFPPITEVAMRSRRATTILEVTISLGVFAYDDAVGRALAAECVSGSGRHLLAANPQLVLEWCLWNHANDL